MVSAIECLAGHVCRDQRFRFEEVEKFKAAVPLLERLAGTPETAEVISVLKEELLGAEHFLRNKFVRFIAEHLTDEFWTVPDDLYAGGSALPRIEKDVLVTCLRKAYDARSAYVHGGEPFPAYVKLGTRAMVPVDVMLDVERLRGRDSYMPTFAWFERVVHVVFIEYLRRAVAPGLKSRDDERRREAARLRGVLGALSPEAQESLRRLTQWIARFVGFALIGPSARNHEWAVNAESVTELLEAGLIACGDPSLSGSSCLKDREAGEVIGEWVFGVAENPFRGSQILPPKGWPPSSRCDV